MDPLKSRLRHPTARPLSLLGRPISSSSRAAKCWPRCPRSRRRRHLKINQIEKKVSIDHTRHCIDTYNKNKQIHVRIHSTVNVIRARIFIMLSVLEVTQRVPPTCIINTSRTHRPTRRPGQFWKMQRHRERGVVQYNGGGVDELGGAGQGHPQRDCLQSFRGLIELGAQFGQF